VSADLFSSIMSFLLAAGSVDQVTEWQELTSAQRAATKAAYNAAGIKLMVSAFGSSDFPTSSGYNAVTLAQQMTAWVLQYNVDGIDVDYEVCLSVPTWSMRQPLIRDPGLHGHE
jgi:chitinase